MDGSKRKLGRTLELENSNQLTKTNNFTNRNAEDQGELVSGGRERAELNKQK
jgi:hypothetical protein